MHIADPQPVQWLENPIFPLLLRNHMQSRFPLLLRAQRLRLSLLFLPLFGLQTDFATIVPRIGRLAFARLEVQRTELHFILEDFLGAVWWVGEGEEVCCDVRFCAGRVVHGEALICALGRYDC